MLAPVLALTPSRFNGFADLSNMNYHCVEKQALPASGVLRIGAGEAHAPEIPK